MTDPLIPSRPPANPAWLALKCLASLQLTVALFALGTVLVFYGTLAQVDAGVWTVVDKYFYSWSVDVPNQLNVVFLQKFFGARPDLKWGGTFPLPAGKLVGGLMLVNLLAAHAVRFKLAWRRAGVLLVHAGVSLMLVGELVTRESAVEAYLMLNKGETKNYLEVARKTELVVFPDAAEAERQVVVVPDDHFKKPGTIRDEALPFDIEVLHFWKNSSLDWDRPLYHGSDADGLRAAEGGRPPVVEQPEGNGVSTGAKEDWPAVKLLVRSKTTGAEVGTCLLSLAHYAAPSIYGESFVLPRFAGDDGKTYRVELRNARTFLPYSVRCVDCESDYYPGTTIPKNYASTLHVVDPERGRDWTEKLAMNDPLRYRGLAFFQSGIDARNSPPRWTILQVVRNPGWLLPYISCVIVVVGMAVQFLTTLEQVHRPQGRGGGRAAGGGRPGPVGAAGRRRRRRPGPRGHVRGAARRQARLRRLRRPRPHPDPRLGPDQAVRHARPHLLARPERAAGVDRPGRQDEVAGHALAGRHVRRRRVRAGGAAPRLPHRLPGAGQPAEASRAPRFVAVFVRRTRAAVPRVGRRTRADARQAGGRPRPPRPGAFATREADRLLLQAGRRRLPRARGTTRCRSPSCSKAGGTGRA